jgi:glutathione reductase (NADPH)
MYNCASFAEHLQDSKDYGFDIENKGFDWSIIKKSRDEYVKRLNDIYKRNLKKDNVTEIKGFASLFDKNTVSVGDKKYTSKYIVIATGGYPTPLKISGAHHAIDSDGFFELKKVIISLNLINSNLKKLL